MFQTIFLKDENTSYKNFEILNTKNIPKNNIANFRIYNDVKKRNMRIACENFYFSDGSVYLKAPNELYVLEHITHKTDLILPRDIQINDWVVFIYDQKTSLTEVSHDKITPIKIHGNGRRIMGLDEPLICDMPFMSLRLSFLGDIDGWVVT